jgi:soluble lytic murein transglycosylase-like protein
MREEQIRRHKVTVIMATGMLTLSLVTVALADNHATKRQLTHSQNRFTPQLAEQIIRIAREEGVDPLLTLEVMRAESGFRRRAHSHKGARGLMQIIPATAMRFGVSDPYDPEQAIRGGCRYLKFLNERYGGRLELVLAGYNAGEGAVDRYGRRIPPYRETRWYVASIMRGYRRAKQIEKAVLKKGYGPGLRTHQVSSRGRYQISKQNSLPLTDAQIRARLESFGRIPRLGQIASTGGRR